MLVATDIGFSKRGWFAEKSSAQDDFKSQINTIILYGRQCEVTSSCKHRARLSEDADLDCVITITL